MCAKELPLNEARLTVSCAEHDVPEEPIEFSIREAGKSDRKEVERILDRAWGETDIDVFGKTFDVLAGHTLVAVEDSKLLGLIALAMDKGEQAVVALSVYPEYQGHGVGSALLEEAASRAERAGLPFIKAAVSNDDIPLLYFYQRHGFVLYDAVIGGIADVLDGQAKGFSQIPITDELRLRRPLCPAR
jgi:GNAT superfamily N-acetyltransferase